MMSVGDEKSFTPFDQRRQRILEGIARGETAMAEGRMLTNAEAHARMSKWLKHSKSTLPAIDPRHARINQRWSGGVR